MSDAAWGFWGGVVGSLIGGLIAWVVAVKAARVQIEAIRSIEEAKQSRDLLLRFLREIDEYVHLSFRQPAEEWKLDRQRACRVMLTTAMIAAPEEVDAITKQVNAVETYHRARADGTGRSRATYFTSVREYFDGLQTRLCQEKLHLRSPLAGVMSEPMTGSASL